MSGQCQHSSDATTFDSIWGLLSLHEQFDDLSLELAVHQSSIRCLAKAYVQQNNASQNQILAAGGNEVYCHSTQLQEIDTRLAAIDNEFDVLHTEQLSKEAKAMFSLLCSDNQQEDVTNSRCEGVERLLWNFIRESSNDVHRCSSRIIAKKDLICDLEKCVQEKVEIMKTTAQLRMEAALRAKFQQQRYAFILSVVHGLETAYKKALASASVDIANRISIRDDARTRIERLRDQLEDLTISAERLAQEWILDENHLQFTLNCLRQTKDALLLSTRRVTTNDDAEKKELNVLRRQRATLLIKTCKGNATLLSLRQINKRKPKMKFDLDTRLIQRRNPLS